MLLKLLLIASLSYGCQTIADSSKNDATLVILGDSLNRGAFSHLAFGKKLEWYDLLYHLSVFQKGVSKAELEQHFSRPELNAYTGEQIRNVAQRLGIKGSSFDCSTSGAGSALTPHCIDRFHAKRPFERVDNIFYSLGNNDFCRNETFRTSEFLLDNLKQLAKAFPTARFHIFGPLPSYRLQRVKGTVLKSGYLGEVTCKMMHEQYCAPLGEKNAEMQWKSFESNYRSAVLRFSKAVPNDVFYSDLSGLVEIASTKYLAIDCFHLSRKGQEYLANIAYKNLRKK